MPLAFVRHSPAHSKPSQAAPSWRALPVPARVYVAAIVASGLAVLIMSTSQIREADAPLLTALAVLSFVTAFAKITVAIPGSSSTLSLCYVIDFTTLLVLGPAAAACTAAAGVWSQSTFRTRNMALHHRTWFSVGALVLTVRISGSVLDAFGGLHHIAVPALVAVVATAAVYFLLNTMLIAGAVALTTAQSTVAVWRKNFLSLWVEYVLGFSCAIGGAVALMRSRLWLLPIAAAFVALTYDKLHAYVEGLSESLGDAMTGLPNLRYLRAHVPQELDRARRENKRVAVMMIDLNEFKSINDQFGHAAGDRALRHVADRLHASIRSYDVCARYAGDEFVVVLPGCDANEARRKAEVLRDAVASHPFAPTDDRATALRISVGCAVFPEDGETLEDLLAVADREMFREKHQRRMSPAGVRGAAARLSQHPVAVFAHQ